jgi:signal transduction histidine kinase
MASTESFDRRISGGWRWVRVDRYPVYGVGHESRYVRWSLQGNLEGVLDGVVEASPETWAKLHDEARRLRRLVDDLQELSRAESRQIPLSIRLVPPATIVQSAVVRLDAQFREKGLALQVTIPPNLPPVRADRVVTMRDTLRLTDRSQSTKYAC